MKLNRTLVAILGGFFLSVLIIAAGVETNNTAMVVGAPLVYGATMIVYLLVQPYACQ